MADLSHESLRAEHQLPVDHEPTTDACSERDHARVIESYGGTTAPFRQGRTRCIVSDTHLETERIAKRRPYREFVRARQIGRRTNHPFAGYQTREPHADVLSPTKIAHDTDECLDESRVRRRRHFDLTNDPRAFVNNNTETLCTANIDTDATTHDSTRVFNSLSVLRMRFSARRLTKPGSGNTSSIAKA